tara:strand:- start:191 stop:4576 length:4386 start_codon:yes stop_codon:yes gene_type:complete
MKPLKGMNQDVSSANMPDGSYRRAQNFVYGKELDALIQEPGLKSLGVNGTSLGGKAICGVHPLPNDEFLIFAYNPGTTNGAGSSVFHYNPSTTSNSAILQNNDLKFNADTLLSVESFQNAAGETVVVFTDGVNPLRILNLTTPDTDMTTNKVFPDFDIVNITAEVAKGTGQFQTGTHFFAVAYEQKDGSRTVFQGLHGPFPCKDQTGSFELSLSNIDTDYEFVLIASLTFTGTALEAKIQRRVPATASSIVRLIDNVNPYQELTLAELVARPQVYTKAKTLALHENRLYLGNVVEHAEEDLQEAANLIEPIWIYGQTAKGGTKLPESLDETLYPDNLRFMPGEVYAFYVQWVRADGSVTKAYHIPGPAPDSNFQFTYDHESAEGLSADPTFNVNVQNTLSDVIASDGDGHLNFLEYDKAAGNTFFYQSRDTAKRKSSLDPTGDSTQRKRGTMGFWENQNEVYPSNFPVQKRFTFSGGGSLNTATFTLAGEKVRHHRIPFMSTLQEIAAISAVITESVGLKYDQNYDQDSRPTVHVEFENACIPPGYVGCQFFHAKRTIQNCTILGQSDLFHDFYNTYSAGRTGENYTDYCAPSGLNAHNLNYATAPGNSNQPSFNNWNENVRIDKARMHPFDMLRSKPRVSEDAGKHYLRYEMVLVARAKQHTQFEAPESINDDFFAFIVDPASDFDIQELFDDFSAEQSTSLRNRIMAFDYSGAQYYTLPKKIRVKPLTKTRYLAPGIFDVDNKVDNRGGEECVHANIQHSVSGVDMKLGGTGSSGEDFYKFVWRQLKAIGDSGSRIRTVRGGYWLDFMGSVNESTQSSQGQGGYADSDNNTPTNALPVVNICTVRSDVYQGYTSQDLVACTPVVGTLGDSVVGTVTNNLGQTLNTLIGTASNAYGTIGKVTYDKVHGDMAVSKLRYRTTAFSGWTHARASGSNGHTNVTDGSSPSADRGTVRVAHKLSLYTQANFFFIDTEQSRLRDYDFLGSLDMPISPDKTNDFTLELGFLKLNDVRSPSIYDRIETYTNSFPYRVHRSLAQTSDEPDINIRTFLAFESFEQTRNRGEIVNLQSYITKLLIHHERGLFVTRGKEKIASTAGEIAFGTGDIFAVPPTEVVPTPNGFAGTQHPQSCILTPGGYFFADASQGKLFQYSEQLREISAQGMKQFFFDTLTSLNSAAPQSGQTYSYHPGISTVYDPRWNRVIFTIRNDKLTNTPATFGFNVSQEGQESPGYFDQDNDDVIVSYNLDLSNWTSFHDYRWTGAVSTQNRMFSFGHRFQSTDTFETKIFEHNILTEPFTKFHGGNGLLRRDAFIDAVLRYQDGVVFSNVNWYTKAMDHAESTYGFVNHDTTFTHATIYNDYQCSGEVALVRTVQSTLVDRTANLRADDYVWRWNDFRDKVENRTLRFVDSDGAVIQSNISNSLNWFEQRRIVGNHATVRLRFDNTVDSTIGLYLYDIDAKVRKSYR